MEALCGLHELAAAVDSASGAGAGHSRRVAAIASALAAERGWAWQDAADLGEAALLHDIGMAWVPARLLRSRRTMCRTEHERVRPHAALGASMVAPVLAPHQVAWVRHHHERFDGRGYPDGLSGEDIPEGARLMAVADTWDALVTGRPYRAAVDRADALTECRRVTGRQLCPDAVAALARVVA
jgi:HD-GYP domain-containing protein (c-di-GMP phosphodiesterase class II)